MRSLREVLGRRSGRVALVIGAVVVVAAAVVVLLVSGENGDEKAAEASSATASLRAGGLESLASQLGQTFYWVGPHAGVTYEFTETADRRIYVRYLPHGVRAGSQHPYLTVASYPLAHAFATTRAASLRAGMVTVRVGGGGVAFYEGARPTNGYLAFPGKNVQVELFSPNGGIRGLISRASPVSGPAAAQAPVVRNGPVTASTSILTTLQKKRGKPVYWLGRRPGRTIELTRSPDGRVYVRYLPPGVALGAKAPYLTVATYPLANAFAATRETAAEAGMVRVPLSGGTVAFYSRARPTNVYLSFPGSNEQVELFDPSASVVHALAGKVAPVP